MNLPVYLDDENLDFIEKIAEKKNTDISSVVNELIKTDRKLVDVIR